MSQTGNNFLLTFVQQTVWTFRCVHCSTANLDTVIQATTFVSFLLIKNLIPLINSPNVRRLPEYSHYFMSTAGKSTSGQSAFLVLIFLSISNHKQIFKSQTHMNIIKVVLDIYKNCLRKGSPRKLLNLPRSFPQFRHLAVII